MKRFSLLLAAMCLFILVSCTQNAEQDDNNETENYEDVQENSGKAARERSEIVSGELQFSGLSVGDTIVVIETEKGTIKAVLYEEYAPLAVENFVNLVESGYYNECEFFRIEQDFIIQSGDPENTGKGGMSFWNEPFNIEITENLRHYSGALCMAAGELEQKLPDDPENPDSGSKYPVNGSQFYIVQTFPSSISSSMASQMDDYRQREEVIDAYKQAGGLPYLDGKDTVFGQVYYGMDVVDKIASGSLDENGMPKKPVKIESIKIEDVTLEELQ